jgi:hypothetical protein
VAINPDAEFRKPALHQGDLDIGFFAQLSCHTGGYGFLAQSKCAIADFYSPHIPTFPKIMQIEHRVMRAATPIVHVRPMHNTTRLIAA